MASTICLIPSNPDIAGIGVRISIYVQSATALVPAALKIIEDLLRRNGARSQTTQFHKTVVNWENIEGIATPNVILGFALLVSSLIQAHLYGLTVYHAIILLNLHIIIGFSVLPYFILSINDKSENSQRRGMIYSVKMRLLLFHMVHMSCAAGFGLWLFGTIDDFDDSDPNCTSSTFFYVFGKKVNVDHSGFRDFWIVIYSFLFIPAVNYVFLSFVYVIFLLVTFVFFFLHIRLIINILGACTSIDQKYFLRGGQLANAVVAALSPGALMLFLTEAMIKVNHVSEGESQWTFGQTIALFVALWPLWNAYKLTKETMKRIRAGIELPKPDVPGSTASEEANDEEANGGNAPAAETTAAIEIV
ncbi:hypothetical protein BD410DRAFT_788406 [Rickenella mellea]|uniref:Uncharacterized protein n=1 Tax=Rickenella mellea TaxID=50990 RepID=A0A4Y7Q4T7_9AGAM|nr:hypothetical protein BD410DRAFT_788406 [Rickenella mellea]